MNLTEQTETTFIVRNPTSRGDLALGIMVIFLGLLALASISYVFEYGTLICVPQPDDSISCQTAAYRISGVAQQDLTNVLAVYVTEVQAIGTGRFQIRRDQIVLVADQGEVAVPYFYSAEFGEIQALASRIAQYLNDPRGRTLELRQNHQVEHEFLNVVAGFALIALGHAQIVLQVQRWEFDRSEGVLQIIKQRVIGRQILAEEPVAVRIERTSDYRMLREHEQRRSWVAVQFASGKVQRITHRYKDNAPAYGCLEPLVRDLRGFLGV